MSLLHTTDQVSKLAKRVSILERIRKKEISQIDGAEELGLNTRQVRRLMQNYKENGIAGLEHGLIGKESNNKKVDEDVIGDIVKTPEFKDFGPTFAAEKAYEIFDIKVSKETMRKIMIKKKVWQEKTKEKHDFRSRRPRKDCLGEMEQFDGSYHKRFEDRNEEFCLLLAVNDATGRVHAKLADNESYENVVDFWIEYMIVFGYGIPKTIYLDKFSTYKVNHKKATYEKDLRTNFDRAMRMLGCELISAHSPQAKGRVERCNRIFQQRFVRELRLAGISDMVAGNKFLKEVFIPKHNKQFGHKPINETNLHKPITEEQKANIHRIFARQYERKLGSGYVIQYATRCFQIAKPVANNYVVYPKKTLQVLETIGGDIRILSGEKDVIFKEIDPGVVKMGRALRRSSKYKQKQEEQEISAKAREEARMEASRQKQIKYKVQNSIQKSKQKSGSLFF